MNINRLFLAAGFFLAAVFSSRSATTVVWDGGGGDSSWQTAANWVGDTVPGTDDAVVINMPGVLTVTSSADISIKSLQCGNSLSIVSGIFGVTAGASIVQGALSMSSGTVLSAAGSGTSLTVNGTTAANDANFSISGGAKLSLPGMSNYTKFCVGANWTVTGSGSVLDLPGLTNITGAECVFPTIQATAGGRLLATNLASITAGPLTFLADGGGSVIDFSRLRTCAGNPGYAVTLDARNGGILVAPVLTTLYNADLNVSGGSFVSLPGLRDFAKGCAGANWTVTGSNSVLDLSGLTNITGAECTFPTIQATAGGHLLATNLATITAGPLTFLADGDGSLIVFSGLRTCAANAGYGAVFDARNGGRMVLTSVASAATMYGVDFLASGGGVLSLPGMSSYTKLCAGANWTVTGSNSVLDLPGLTNITGAECNFPTIQATAGGHLLATNLATITAGPLTFLADGGGSLIDFNGLQSCAGNPGYNVTFDARNGGAVRAFASLLPGHAVHMTLQLLNGGTVWAPTLTTLDDGDLNVSGGVLSLPGLRNFAKGCNGANWTVAGSGSVLDLPGLTNITGAECTFPTIQATAGGHLLATNLATITAGPLTFLADGGGSVIDFKGLRTCAGNAQYAVTFDARNGGTLLAPVLTTLYNVDLNVSGGSFLSLPGLRNFAKGCAGAAWTVTGSNSVLDLPGLTNITSAECTFPTIQATAGGHLLAPNLAKITAGPLTFLADGDGSLIDFRGLRDFAANPVWGVAFVARNGGTVDLSAFTNLNQEALTLEVQNGGHMVFSDKPFFMTGVTLTFPPLSPILPPTLLFHGQPWHSYVLEMRSTLQPQNPWVLIARVPMTNELLVIAPSLPPNMEFRASEFVADPPILDLMKLPGVEVQLVLYGAINKTYTVQSTNRLTGVSENWPFWTTVGMTNAFRILPAIDANEAQRFFRARE